VRLGGLGNGVEDGLGGVWLHLPSVSAGGGLALRNPLKPVEIDLQLGPNFLRTRGVYAFRAGNPPAERKSRI
jgi:hypothetical protein